MRLPTDLRELAYDLSQQLARVYPDAPIYVQMRMRRCWPHAERHVEVMVSTPGFNCRCQHPNGDVALRDAFAQMAVHLQERHAAATAHAAADAPRRRPSAPDMMIGAA